jgi:hypothetical protein
MKRGELSMEVIIIAAIALLVLVILSVLIIRSAGNVDSATKCASPSTNGICTPKDSSCDDGYIPGGVCDSDNKCCIPLVKQG